MRSCALAALLALAGGLAYLGRVHGGKASNDGPCTPQQVHVALTGNPTELRVSWKTDGPSCPSAVSAGPAGGANPARLAAHAGSQHSYSSADTCAAPARNFKYVPAYLHTAVLTGLTPGERYVYQIEGGEPVPFAAPRPVGATHSFSFLVFGDLGESSHKKAKSPGARRTVEQLARECGEEGGPELLLHVGDIAYANGREQIWDAFVESIEPFARSTPYMVAVGNHEYDWAAAGARPPAGGGGTDASGEAAPYDPDWGNYGNDSGGECGVQISRRFAMPDVADHGYWTRRAADASSGAVGGSSSSGAAGSSSSSSSPGGGSFAANPTLGPDAEARVAAALRAWQQPQPQQPPQLQREADQRAGADSSAGALPRPNPPFWYSFSHGSVHFVVVSSEHDLRPGSRQYTWLARDLSLVDRCATPWVVLAIHRPLYVVYPHKSNRVVGDHLRDQLEGLLDEYRVDLVLSGHVHSYSRTCNVLGGRCIPADEGGTTHIIVGCAGHRLTDVEHGQEEWLEYAAVRHGYGRVTVNAAYSLLFEFVGEDDVVHDSVRLYNSRAAARGCASDAAAGVLLTPGGTGAAAASTARA